MASATQTQNLTTNDNVVLSQLFDPEASPSSITIDPSLPSDPHVPQSELSGLQEREKAIIQSIELAIRNNPETKSSTLTQARIGLESLATEHPTAALLWNDLAQVLRLQHGDDILLSSPSSPLSPSTIEAAQALFAALSTTILLHTPTAQVVTPRVSPAQARTLSSALLQRGALYNAAYKHLTRDPDSVAVVSELNGVGKDEFQERASGDFFEAGRLGNELGRALAVHVNPSAKLCGQMVRDAMRREVGGEQ